MAIIARGKSRDFAPAPEGLHRAVCVDVVDLGMVDGQFGRKHKVMLSWQIEETMDNGKPFLVSKRYTLSLHKKSALRPDLESWRGKPFSEVEAEGFDLEKLLGANAQLNIVHNKVDDATFANISAVVPAAKGAPALKARDYTRVCDREGYEPPEPEETEPGEDRTDYSSGAAEEEIPF
jgi:hypothetical protein